MRREIDMRRDCIAPHLVLIHATYSLHMLTVVFALCLVVLSAMPASAEPLTLAQAVERARTASPLREGASALADGARLAATYAGRPLNPFADVRIENLAPRTNPIVERDIFAVVSQPIEIGGKRALRRDLAGADRDVAALVLRTIERQVALDTVHAYMRAVRARDALATVVSQQEGVATLVTTMRRRVEEGFSAESDLLRFETEASRLTVEHTRTAIELARALQELGTLMGAAAPIAVEQLVSPTSVDVPSLDDSALIDAASQRPDVQLTMLRWQRAKVAADLEHQRRLPDPAISAGYKRTQGHDTAVAGVAMAIPLFERNAQNIAVSLAAARAAEADHEAGRLRAAAEARSALTAARALAAAAANLQRDLLAPAEGVRNAAQAMFREGATDVLKLVDAERVYADVRRDALSLAVDAYVAAIDARFALAQEQIP